MVVREGNRGDVLQAIAMWCRVQFCVVLGRRAAAAVALVASHAGTQYVSAAPAATMEQIVPPPTGGFGCLQGATGFVHTTAGGKR